MAVDRLAEPGSRPTSGAGFREHERVTLAAAVMAGGRTLPLGATGTVVSVWEAGRAYEVEFIRPFAAVVTVSHSDISSGLTAGRG